jgi:uncharacterized protein DUF4384
MLLSLLMLLGSSPARPPDVTPAADPDPPIHVWLNSNGSYELGDHAKVYVRAARPGYLVVLHAAPDGRVRVLFPLNPGDDQHVQGGKKYEIKGRGGHEAFQVDDSTGHGTVLAAVAAEPFRLDAIAKDGRWNFEALSAHRDAKDAEAGLMSLAQEMQPGGTHFDYDIATYVAGSQRYAVYPYGYLGWWGPRFGFWFGPPYWHRWGWRRW